MSKALEFIAGLSAAVFSVAMLWVSARDTENDYRARFVATMTMVYVHTLGVAAILNSIGII